ncbi:MAG: DEAD/DEAH box helicase family protein [Hydrogenobacter thermophilus]|uniref:DEAD/DEAH box helicase family protein n=1 Tax=Hydrogenobacter thermophilus TaxID=940 RepID=UPI001C77C8B5|nr:DEAD/DEAH box helicase family protein [Hydrogenobacter thermophilus]QWK19121.1 MAG: DEAD/DEAH box helicase family protein [Hydrogenobacter thermophilus]
MPVATEEKTIKPVLLNFVESLSEGWDIGVSEDFSKEKKLFAYQKQAIVNTLKALYSFYERHRADKGEFARIYAEYYDLLSPKVRNEKLLSLLSEFYRLEGDTLPFAELCNRMSFWMATGSGKTLVIVKLIDLLFDLMQEKAIPQKPILFLTAREDLVDAFRRELVEFNISNPSRQILPVSLAEYEKEKVQESLFRRVFYYRMDLISDERGDKTLDFRSFLDRDREGNLLGNWYVILDEAHKGGKEESKRQFLVSLLSKDGFLFNFSATFTEAIDIATTVYNLNLSEFISKGYGKQIYLSYSEVEGFEKNEEEREFSKEEKKKVILKTLILLAGLKKAKKKLPDLYHNPLTIYLVNSVNVEESDLKLLFEELLNFARFIPDTLFKKAREELAEEFRDSSYILGDGKLVFMGEILMDIQIEDIYREVYNANSSGTIEYQYYEKNDQEVVLKHTGANTPFALIKIGSIRDIKKNLLWDYQETVLYEDPKHFERLNDPDSPINLLIGSRAFYEGWDSPRPNLIVFINLGTQADAKKFVLQATGRGVRIEPVKNRRQRLKWVSEHLPELRDKVDKPEVKALETLFVFATSRKAVETILNELTKLKEVAEYSQVELYKNPEVEKQLLLIPRYKTKGKSVFELENPPKFKLSEENYKLLKFYLDLMPKERFALERNSDLEKLREIVKNSGKYLSVDNEYHYRNFEKLLKALLNYSKAQVQDIDKSEPFIPLPEDAIVHFKEIMVKKELVEKFKRLAEEVFNAKEMSESEKLKRTEDYVNKGKTFEEAYKLVIEETSFIRNIDGITLEKILSHYYIPIVYTKKAQDLVKHVISVESEVDFIESLKGKVDKLDKICEYWFFSKLDEQKDKIYIPYMDKEGRQARFIPDFIFWLKLREGKYLIYFIDPKGSAHTDYERKLDGYERIFVENGKPKEFEHKGLKVEVRLKLFNKDYSGGEKYKDYWVNSQALFEDLVV